MTPLDTGTRIRFVPAAPGAPPSRTGSEITRSLVVQAFGGHSPMHPPVCTAMTTPLKLF
jgi:hypothetical protein